MPLAAPRRRRILLRARAPLPSRDARSVDCSLARAILARCPSWLSCAGVGRAWMRGVRFRARPVQSVPRFLTSCSRPEVRCARDHGGVSRSASAVLGGLFLRGGRRNLVRRGDVRFVRDGRVQLPHLSKWEVTVSKSPCSRRRATSINGCCSSPTSHIPKQRRSSPRKTAWAMISSVVRSSTSGRCASSLTPSTCRPTVGGQNPDRTPAVGCEGEGRHQAWIGKQVRDRHEDVDRLLCCREDFRHGEGAWIVPPAPRAHEVVQVIADGVRLRSGRRRRKDIAGPELVLRGVQRAGDNDPVALVGGAAGEPSLNGLGIDVDDLSKLLRGHAGPLQSTPERWIRHQIRSPCVSRESAVLQGLVPSRPNSSQDVP